MNSISSVKLIYKLIKYFPKFINIFKNVHGTHKLPKNVINIFK